MSRTIRYYDSNAAEFVQGTLAVDMSSLYQRFLAHVPDGGLILDAGCGSGRDSKAFIARGFRVRAFDASETLARLAQQEIGQPVTVRRFEDITESSCYDGIWACASLLHVREADLPDTFARLWNSLKPGGILYFSFKHGEHERFDGQRHFTDATEARLAQWIQALSDKESLQVWFTADQRAERSQQWLNGLLKRRTVMTDRIVGDDPGSPFLLQLCQSIARADEVDFAVSFVKTTGLRLLLPDLHLALERIPTGQRPGTRLRILTSDYLGITDPEALRLLLLLKARGAKVRVFETRDTGFHLKGYLFAHFSEPGSLCGTAFIGSSNVSRQALTDGLEWNYRIDYPQDDGFLEARARFEQMFHHPCTVDLTDAWIDHYENRRVPPAVAVSPGSTEREQTPEPTPVQVEALQALAQTRLDGYRRGLVVMATGLGKTWLATFDAGQLQAKRILFVAHREEILNQAAETFLRIRPQARVGFYMGQTRDTDVDVLCASIQTLGRQAHLQRFARGHFDYIVVDEFHHAAAPSYRQLLVHFEPGFLLGLTATPDRTDQSDILSLCDDNLVYRSDLRAGIEAGLLAPFQYHGIWDESVDYQEIPWRNGKFDPDSLSNKLATLARARHAIKQWRDLAQQRTLAFCVSISHAEFMAQQFQRAGIDAAAVYAGSKLARAEALEQLSDNRLRVLFSVDLFNEGVDLPSIDTVLMLRPTESKILFLQQLGRGLRKAAGKQHLVVLDFIGNHHSFLGKLQAIAQVGSTRRTRVGEIVHAIENQRLWLAPGCFINLDLQVIDFLRSFSGDGVSQAYEALRNGLGRRPTLSEYYYSGASVSRVRAEYGSWFDLVSAMGDLGATKDAEEGQQQPQPSTEKTVLDAHRRFLVELETTQMTKSFKMVLLEAFQELDGWIAAPTIEFLAQRSWEILQRRRPLLTDLPEEFPAQTESSSRAWQRYWTKNPVNAWTGGNRASQANSLFQVKENRFEPSFKVDDELRETMAQMVQEIIDYRLAQYSNRSTVSLGERSVAALPVNGAKDVELPYFPNLRIACGHFRAARADAEQYRRLGPQFGTLDPARNFIARASGNSMDGGSEPIHDGDYLLLELPAPDQPEPDHGSIMVIERQNEQGEDQYVLRVVNRRPDGGYVLVANNPAYADLMLDRDTAKQVRFVARLKIVVDPLEFEVGRAFMREAIPKLFGQTFNPGNWNSGHVVAEPGKTHVLLVTLNKQGKAQDQRYLDHWINDHTFHWQSQQSTTPLNKRGRDIIEHDKKGIAIHLFVRDNKLQAGRAAPFVYHGKVRYRSHEGSAPLNVVFDVPGGRHAVCSDAPATTLS